MVDILPDKVAGFIVEYNYIIPSMKNTFHLWNFFQRFSFIIEAETVSFSSNFLL